MNYPTQRGGIVAEGDRGVLLKKLEILEMVRKG